MSELPAQRALAPGRTLGLGSIRKAYDMVAARKAAPLFFVGLLALFLFFWRLEEPAKYIYDEVYHSYTANLYQQNDPKPYEWWMSAPQEPIEGVQYEWTHPPLAKLIIAGGIKLFGDDSLGWRFFSMVWGVASVMLLYTLASLLFHDRLVATIAGAFLAIEGLAFAEARIGTNDIYQLGFLLAGYACFALFLRRPARAGIGLLFLCGLFLGLALACKWPALYSIVLLAAIAFVRGVWPVGGAAGNTQQRAEQSTGSGLVSDGATAGRAAANVWQSQPSGPPQIGQARASGSENALVVGGSTSPLHKIELIADSGPPSSFGIPASGSQNPAMASQASSAVYGAVSSAGSAQPSGMPSRWNLGGRALYLLSTFVSLIAVPFCLYLLSYVQMFLQHHEIPEEYRQVGPLTVGPLSLGPADVGSGSWWDMFVGEQWQMWRYHTTLTSSHPYYSVWWQWLLDIRPVYYFVNRTDDFVQNIYALGNPLVYWAFPVAIVGAALLVWKQRNAWLAFALGGFLINWLPWVRAPRGMFFYHFLPSVPFLVLLLAYGLGWLWRRPQRHWQRLARWYVVAAVISFAFFYTQLAGWPVPEWYAEIHFWLPSWE